MLYILYYIGSIAFLDEWTQQKSNFQIEHKLEMTNLRLERSNKQTLQLYISV